DAPNASPAGFFKAPSVVPEAYNWAGFYVGGILGTAWGDTTWSSQPVSCIRFFSCPGSVSPGLAGITIGGEVGYNYQFGRWIAGLEGDLAWSNANGSVSCISIPGFTCSNDHLDRLGTATGRVGYSWDRLLVYGKGGAAVAQDNYSISQTQIINH